MGVRVRVKVGRGGWEKGEGREWPMQCCSKGDVMRGHAGGPLLYERRVAAGSQEVVKGCHANNTLFRSVRLLT